MLIKSCKAIHAAHHMSGTDYKCSRASEQRFPSAEVSTKSIVEDADYSAGEVKLKIPYPHFLGKSEK